MASRLNQSEDQVVNELAALTSQSEMFQYMEPYADVGPRNVVSLLAKLSTSPEPEHQRAYENALVGLKLAEAHHLSTKGFTPAMGELLQAARELDATATELKADLVEAHTKALDMLPEVARAVGGPSELVAGVAAPSLVREVARLIASDAANVVRELRAEGSDALAHVIKETLARHDGDPGAIEPIFRQLAAGIGGGMAALDPTAPGAEAEAKALGSVAGYAIGELVKGAQQWAEDYGNDVRQGASIVAAGIGEFLGPLSVLLERPVDAVGSLGQEQAAAALEGDAEQLWDVIERAVAPFPDNLEGAFVGEARHGFTVSQDEGYSDHEPVRAPGGLSSLLGDQDGRDATAGGTGAALAGIGAAAAVGAALPDLTAALTDPDVAVTGDAPADSQPEGAAGLPDLTHTAPGLAEASLAGSSGGDSGLPDFTGFAPELADLGFGADQPGADADAAGPPGEADAWADQDVSPEVADARWQVDDTAMGPGSDPGGPPGDPGVVG